MGMMEGKRVMGSKYEYGRNIQTVQYSMAREGEEKGLCRTKTYITQSAALVRRITLRYRKTLHKKNHA